MDFVHRCGV